MTILRDAPKRWRIVSIADVVSNVEKKDPVAFGRKEFRYIDIGSIDNKTNRIARPQELLTKDAPGRARQIVQKGDTVFSTVRPYLKNIAYVDEYLDGEVASTGFCVVRPVVEIADPRFVHFFMLSDHLLEQVLPLQRGVSYPAVRDREVMTSLIPLPPLTEQQRIVEILEEQFSLLDAALASVRTVRERAKSFRRSLLHAALSGAMANCRDGWIELQLGDCVEFLSGYAFRSEWYEEDGVRLARGQNVSHGFLDWSDARYISAERSQGYSKFSLSEGDLLLALDRPLISSGLKWSEVRRHDLPALLLQRVAKMSSCNETLRQEYLKFWLQSDYLIGVINPGRSIGVPHISIKELAALLIRLPPLATQEVIVNFLDEQLSRVNDVAEIVRKIESRIASKRRSLLHAAFAGTLTARWRESQSV